MIGVLVGELVELGLVDEVVFSEWCGGW